MNPALGVFFHWLGGLASASFYVPYRGVKNWAWETYWLVGGFFSWIIAPWILALTMTHDLMQVLHEAPASSLLWAYVFGVLWGLGGLTFGLTMRYLGMSLGMAMVLGYTAAFGTLMPPIFRGVFASEVLGTHSALVILGGVAVCLVGIAVAGAAGVSKEREMSTEQKRASIKEFDLKKGLLVATFSGVMSACFAYGLAAGDPIKAIAIQHGTPTLWQGLPVLVVVLAGGFTTNFIWCLILNIRNRLVTSTSSPRFAAKSRNVAKSAFSKPPPMPRARKWQWRSPLRLARPSGLRCLRTICSRLSRARPGICSFSSTPWARPRWGGTSSPVGRCTWPASSFSARCGVSL
jgi:L-rhamnose-H+ transport protein